MAFVIFELFKPVDDLLHRIDHVKLLQINISENIVYNQKLSFFYFLLFQSMPLRHTITILKGALGASFLVLSGGMRQLMSR